MANAAAVSDAESFVLHLQTQRGLDGRHVSAVDPAVYSDMGKAIHRLQRALAEGEKIAVFGDYDCDGVTSTALLLRLLQRHGHDPVIRLPHRVHDGYGIRTHHVDAFAEQKISLLLTVDNGIAAHEAMERAREEGIDTLILDHHHFETVPHAHAILHPALSPNHPDPHPSAAGVALAFIRGFEDTEHWLNHDIDRVLAMMGTMADLVPLTGSNRHVVQSGLQSIMNLPQGPLKSFIARTCSGTITSTDVAWRLAPRINAAGRMADPMLALKALTEEGDEADILETLNAQRQSDTADALEEALQSLGPTDDLPAFLCTASASYSPGIVGLIAGKLTERFGRPSFAACIDGDTCTASFRSPPGYNVAAALKRAAHLLTHFGGHAQAAGASFPLDHFVALSDLLTADAQEHMGITTLAPSVQIDGIATPEMIDLHLYRHLSTLAPFGQGNTEPTLLIEGVTLDRIRLAGSTGQHLQARVNGIPVIGFNLGHTMEHLEGSTVDLACHIGVNVWNGKTEAQIVLADVRASRMSDIRSQHEKAGVLTSEI